MALSFRTWVAGEVLAASQLQSDVRDNGQAMYGGQIGISGQGPGDFIHAAGADTLGRVALTSGQVPKGQGTSAPVGAWVLETSQNAANQLDSGDDLDNVTTRGLYQWNASGGSPANTPSGLGTRAVMLVEDDGQQAIQLAWGDNAADGTPEMFIRRRNSGTWAAWKRILSEDDIGTKRLDADPSNVQVVNTTTETTVYSLTVPAGAIGADGLIRVVIIGQLTTDGSQTALTWRLKYGATTVASDSNGTGTGSGTDGFRVEAFLAADGATNAQRGYMNGDGKGSPSSAGGAAAEDSTGALTLALTAQWAGADPNLSVNKLYAAAYLIR